MTVSPSLLLKRLLITAHGRTVYDNSFHAGINIIRGKNSSGKSTICDMIFYVTGGEGVQWTDEAKSCDFVYAEYIVSGMTLSLRREINSNSPSISVCEGALSESMKSLSGWSVYGRKRSDTKESFSQFMFNHLGLPQIKSDDSQVNVTMHQVLRLLYGDQNTDCSSLFRNEKQPFGDRQDIRRSVGEMLLGIDDLQGHELRQEYLRITKQLAQKESRLDSLNYAALNTDSNFTLARYADIIENVRNEQQELEREIDQTPQRTEQTDKLSKEDLNKIRKLKEQVVTHNTKIEKMDNDIQALSLNIADSEIFIASLESDLVALLSANKSRDLIGSVSFQFCPVCLATLSESEDDECPLCKASSTGDAITGGRLRFEQELKHQINESRQLLEARQNTLKKQKVALKGEVSRRNDILGELRSFVSPEVRVDPSVSQLLRKQGYLSRRIEELRKLEALKAEVDSLEKEVQDARFRLDSIERGLKLREEEQEARRVYSQNRICELTVDILHEDIIDKENDSLRDATGLVYSFEKDFLSVRHGRLSASTQAFLKNSFYLGLLKFSVEDEQCRLPRFFILDNIEDKGMVPERFQKFHHLLVDYSQTISIPHQVILTTSYIDGDLDKSEYCVGPSYDHPPFTLDLKGEWEGETEENRKQGDSNL